MILLEHFEQMMYQKKHIDLMRQNKQTKPRLSLNFSKKKNLSLEQTCKLSPIKKIKTIDKKSIQHPTLQDTKYKWRLFSKINPRIKNKASTKQFPNMPSFLSCSKVVIYDDQQTQQQIYRKTLNLKNKQQCKQFNCTEQSISHKDMSNSCRLFSEVDSPTFPNKKCYLFQNNLRIKSVKKIQDKRNNLRLSPIRANSENSEIKMNKTLNLRMLDAWRTNQNNEQQFFKF